jgi:hypothetical protein
MNNENLMLIYIVSKDDILKMTDTYEVLADHIFSTEFFVKTITDYLKIETKYKNKHVCVSVHCAVPEDCESLFEYIKANDIRLSFRVPSNNLLDYEYNTVITLESMLNYKAQALSHEFV